MNLRVIKNNKEYESALSKARELIKLDPAPGSEGADRLELLSILIQNYEKENYTVDLPDPITAIMFRMSEQRLKQRDLIPYIGSRSKVSEILSGKRPLTIKMIRALNEGFNIPLEVLIKESKMADHEETKIDWNKFPLAEIIKRKWISFSPNKIKKNNEGLLKQFFEPLGGYCAESFLCHRTLVERTGRSIDQYALISWIARVLIRASHLKKGIYSEGVVTEDFINKVSRLSIKDTGPLEAQDLLLKHGISLIIEPHLQKTHLDGAAMLDQNGDPVIGLTIRYDRIDSFWFNLIHELVHIWKHLNTDDYTFVDDLDSDPGDDPREREADRLTQEIFIPRTIWKRSDAYRLRTPEAINKLGSKLGINPIIIAGRIRHDTRNYQLLSQMVGKGKVRRLFSSVIWPGVN